MKRVSYGLTNVQEMIHYITISHAGNMGNRIEDVNKNLLKMGYDTIQEMKRMYEVLTEQGSPDYYYKIVFHR